MSFATSATGQSEMNVTPLIDVLLVLIVIFMVIQPTNSKGLQTQQPQGKATASTSAAPVLVEVLGEKAAGAATFRVNRQPITEHDLPAALRQLMATRQERTVFVQANRELVFRQVAEVVAAARQAGATTISLQDPEQSKK